VIPALNHTLTLSPQLYNTPNPIIIPVAYDATALLFLRSGFVLPDAGQHVSTSQVLKQASIQLLLNKSSNKATNWIHLGKHYK
jgi:hypothetical protein